MPNKKENSRKQTRRRTRRIAFFAPTGSEYVGRLAEGVLRYQAEHQHCVVRDFRYDAKEPEDRERWARRPRPWESWPVDGLIVNVSKDPGLAEWVTAGGHPVVNTGPKPAQLTSVCVSSNGTALRAIKHFRACGLTNFGFVTQIENSRLQHAFETRLSDNGNFPHCVLLGVNPTNWDYSNEESATLDPGLERMLRSAPKPIGILTQNDEVGRVVCLAAQRLDLNIPRDVAVLGVNNSIVSRSAVPPLSSIHIPFEDVAYRAMELLERIIDGQPSPRLVEIPPGQVVIRETTGTSAGKSREAEVTRALQLIRERACEGIGLKEIMLTLDISQSTLQREFKRIVGRSPGEELIQARLRRAKELLAMNSLSITQIAIATGYASLTHFSVFFKTQTGITPAAYRQQHRRDPS